MKPPIVQSLWVGNDLSRMEIKSIQSFLDMGHIFHLYIYEDIGNIPNGVIVKDASIILPKEDVFTMKGLHLPFSDIFRYKLLYEKGNYWVDVDMICMRELDFEDPFVFAGERTIQKGAYRNRHHKYLPNNAILKAPIKSDFYKELFEKSYNYQHCHKNKDRIKYLRMMRKLIEKYDYNKYVKSPKTFCHLDWWNAKEGFMDMKEFPSKYGVEGSTLLSFLSNEVYCIHFWRGLVRDKKKLDLNAIYPPNSLWELVIK
jgi:hypothetical protein